MPTKIYWIHSLSNSARIGIMARPRGGDWLEDEIAYLKNNEVGVLVCLLEQDEIYELHLDREEEICLAKNISYINFPIQDRSIPERKSNTDLLINTLATKLEEGLFVVIHCRIGIGRSSIIAASVLLKFGYAADEIIEKISKIRGLKVPDTDMQVEWVRRRQI